MAGAFEPRNGGPIGVAYDPVDDAWRKIAESPLIQGYALDLGWDGSEVVAAYPVPESTDSAADARTTSAAYDPATDSWRRLPRPAEQPHWGTPVQADDAMIFWDASPQPGVAYLMGDENWVALPAVDGPQREFPSLVWTGTEVIAWGGNDNCEVAAGGAADCDLAPLADGAALRISAD
jgi:hypothetical protein